MSGVNNVGGGPDIVRSTERVSNRLASKIDDLENPGFMGRVGDVVTFGHTSRKRGKEIENYKNMQNMLMEMLKFIGDRYSKLASV